MTSTILKLENISKYYGNKKALTNIEWEAEEGKFITVLGPSGCGKSTMLSIIAGLERPDTGKIIFEGIDITHTPAYSRAINTVFQDYALFTHLNVYENIAFSLKIKKLSASQIKKRVSALLETVSLSGYEKRDVRTLSGGEQQRVAIARALANEPKLLLLDEPLSALDLKLRKEMQRELKALQKATKITFVYVTHDQNEALSLSDDIIVINKGSILQKAPPDEIYAKPVNSFAAQFIGDGNILNSVVMDNGRAKVFGTAIINCETSGFKKDETAYALIRPENVYFGSAKENSLTAKVISSIFKGEYYEITADLNGERIKGRSEKAFEAGQSAQFEFKDEIYHLMRS